MSYYMDKLAGFIEDESSELLVIAAKNEAQAKKAAKDMSDELRKNGNNLVDVSVRTKMHYGNKVARIEIRRPNATAPRRL